VRSTAAPYTESRLTRSVANERVGFPVVEQKVLWQTFWLAIDLRFNWAWAPLSPLPPPGGGDSALRKLSL
jgi:hypothetical protein